MKTRSNTTQGQLDKQREDRIAALEKFIKQFAENFEDCDTCNGSGTDEYGDACHSCGGCGEQIASHGLLLAELRPDARDLLKPQ